MDGVGREIERARREEAQRRKERWNEAHPKTAAFKSGWSDHLKKEGVKLSGDAYEGTRRLLSFMK